MEQEQVISDNLYGNYDDLQEEVGSFAPGSVEKVQLVKVEYFQGTSKTGNAYESLNFTYKSVSNNTVKIITDRVLPINLGAIGKWIPKEGETTQSIINEQRKIFNSKMKHIASKFDISHDELIRETANPTSFGDYCTKFSNLMIKHLDKRELHLKISIDNNGNPTLPQYVPFLENSQEGIRTTLKFSDKEVAYINSTLAKKATVISDTVEEILDENDDIDI